MEKLKGTQTEKNIRESLMNECAAAVIYELFAKQAHKDGYVQMEDIFLETASNEKEHASIWYKKLSPNDAMPKTLDNLEWALAAEKAQGVDDYKKFAETAKKEGFDELEELFKELSELEGGHAARFNKLIENIKNDQVFERPEPVVWQCLECGHLEKGKTAPEKCPVCKHPQAYFQIMCENY